MDPYISQKLVASKQREMLAESDRQRLIQPPPISDRPLRVRALEAARALIHLVQLLTSRREATSS